MENENRRPSNSAKGRAMIAFVSSRVAGLLKSDNELPKAQCELELRMYQPTFRIVKELTNTVWVERRIYRRTRAFAGRVSHSHLIPLAVNLSQH
jgi:hypothetical protein